MSKGTDHLLVRVLGPLQIDRRAAEQPLTDRALRAVLSTLLVHANQGVSADTLIDATWPPAQRPARVRDSLDARIGKLRTLLAPEAEISWSSAGCVLHLAPDRIDAVRFERMIEAARWCPAPEAISTLDRALALWRGDALPDLRWAGTEHPEAVRLRQLRARAVEDLAARELETGKVEDAAQRLLNLLSAEPLRERACGYAMWALHHLGMTGDAVACYEQLRERLSDDLGEPTSVELDETFSAVTGRYPGSAHPGRPVPPGTTFVGRGHELARLKGMVDRERLVTVVGPGGCGKTRLVTQTLSTATVGVTVVPLSTRDADELPGSVAGALGIHTHDRDPDPLATVAEYLSGRRRVLVLDSCEHLLTEVRTLVRKLLGRCPAVTVLTTSRVRLGLAEECVLPLGPLARDGTRDPLDSRAGRLFLDRARTVRPDFLADEREADAARAVLRRIECLPLTVELLAARVAAPGWTTPSRWPPDVVEWAHERLTPAQRDVLAALTVFDAGRDTDTGVDAGLDGDLCAAVAEGDDDAESTLAGLARVGLLTPTGGARDERGDRRVRYRLPDLVQRVSSARLAGSDAERKVRERHALWCVDLVERAAGSLTEHGDLGGYERLRRTEGDLRAALRWAVAAEPTLAAELSGGIGLLCAFRPRPRLLPWQVRIARATDPRLSRHALASASGSEAAVRCGLPEEGLRLAARAAELATTLPERCLALHALLCAYYELGHDDRAAAVCRELIGLADRPEVYAADAYGVLALVAARHGMSGEGRMAADKAEAAARRAGSSARGALATYARGRLASAGDPAEAVTSLRAARSEARASDTVWIAAAAGTDLADALMRSGRVPEAGKVLQQVLDDWQRMRALPHLRDGLRLALYCLTAAGDRSRAQSLTESWSEGDPRALGDSDELRTARTARATARALATVFGTARP